MRNRYAAVLAICVLAAGLVAGCDGDTDASSPSPSPSGTVAVGVTATPTEPGTAAPTSTSTSAASVPQRPAAGHASVGLDEGGLPLGAVGPLAVYAKEVPGTLERLEVVVFDLGRGERVSSFDLVDNGPVNVQLAGSRVIAGFRDSLWSYALDGSDALLLSEDTVTGEEQIRQYRVSPDGRAVAFTCGTTCGDLGVWIVDLATGNVIVRGDLAAVPEWKGEPWVAGWAEDGAALVRGLCNCDGNTEEYPAVALARDGSITPAQVPDRPAAGHLELSGGFTDRECALVYSAGDTIRLVEGATGAVVASATVDGPYLYPGRVAPDGSEALVIYIHHTEEGRAVLGRALDSPYCPGYAEPFHDEGEREPMLLRAGAADLEPVADTVEVFERWYDLAPVFSCGGQERPGMPTGDWLTGASAWRAPVGFGEPWAFDADGCGYREARVDMRVGDVAVDTGAAGYRVLGFLMADGGAS